MKKALAQSNTALVPDGSAGDPLHNGLLAELLAQQAEHAQGHWQRALRRAARAACLWPVEAADLVREDRPLTELPAIGPHLQRLLREWIDQPLAPGNHRLGLSADWERVFAEAAELEKAVEVDSYPDRQDLDVELLLLAKKAGVRIAIDTDAHAPEQLAFVELGLAAALLADIKPDRILNFLPPKQLLSWARRPRPL